MRRRKRVGRLSHFLLVCGLLFIGISCSSSGGSRANTEGASELAKTFLNSSIVQQKQCTSCHSVAETGGTVGPKLDQVGNRRTEAWLRTWLKDPNEVKNGTKMPNFQFSESELNEIVSVLTEMKRDMTTATVLGNSSLSAAQKGEEVFRIKDCYACHRIGSEGRFIGPNLTWLGKRKSEEWERDWLKDPPAYKPDTFMPNFKLSEGEIGVLASYLHTLEGQRNEEAMQWEGNVAFILDSRPRQIGEMVYRRFGCDGCHGQSGEGGHKNINTSSDMIPALRTTARDKTKDEIIDIILSGKKVEMVDTSGLTPLSCPAWKGDMSQAEAGYVYDYLLSIAPKKRKFRF